MAEQEKQSRRGRWSAKSLIAVVLCMLVMSAAAVGYAVENDLMELPSWVKVTTFSFNDDGTVTDDFGNVTGQTTENEDGTFTTTIMLEEHGGIQTTTDKPPNGDKFFLSRPKDEKTQGVFIGK